MSGTDGRSPVHPRRRPLAPALSGGDLDRDYLSRLGDVRELLADPRARLVVLRRGRALGTADGALAMLEPGALGELDPDAVVFLGRARTASGSLDAGAPVLALALDDEERVAWAAGEWLELRDAGASLDPRDAGLFAQALALANWHATAAFSPATGLATTVAQAGWVRVDPDTGTELFPRTDPAVIVAVLDEHERILLGSNVGWGERRFSLLAGFVEPGESLEAAVIREIFEEAGVVVTDPEYLGSQPWPYPASLMIGFEARIAPGTSSDPTPDGTELRELRWFSRAELAAEAAAGRIALPRPTSIARAIIDDWYGGTLPDGGAW